MARLRRRLTPLLQKQLQQESNSCCSFCEERDVSTFEFHHIDEDPSNNAPENLIVACSSCHTRITKGLISLADVLTKKREQQWMSQFRKPDNGGVHVNVQNSIFKGDVAQTITKISTPRAPRIAHPPGSIGANLPMKAYVDYLLKRYFTYRKADASYGRRTPFSHSVIHQNIERDFGAKTFFNPESRFPSMVAYLQEHIDATIQGKRNTSKGASNYHSFDEHCHAFDLV
jgi:hypothetical protein